MKRGKGLGYRPDIDGLRAIAVTGVVLFHAWPKSFPGGFLGVDVFFVISGYLITRLLLRSLDQREFKVADFYLRRAVRLLPALALVLSATLLAGLWGLLPDELRALSKHLSAAAYFGSNFVLNGEAGYFDVSSDYKPLLHLWSLAIEEQFYLLWPAALLLTRRPWIWGIVAAFSFGGYAWSSWHHSQASHFLPQFRIWQLLCGCLLAIWESRCGPLQRTSGLLGLAALITLLAATWFANGTLSYLGVVTLGVVLATSHLIRQQRQPSWVTRGLSHPALVWVGRISYPLYLWHWPLLSFAAIIQGRPLQGLEPLPLLALAVALAAATHFALEVPLSQLAQRRRTFVGVSALATLLVLGALGAWVQRLESPGKLSGHVTDEISKARADWDFPSPRLEDRGSRAWINRFSQGQGKSARYAFWGDSTLEQYYPRVDRLLQGKEAKTRVDFYTRGGCPPLPGVEVQGPIPCKTFVEETWSALKTQRYELVVISGRWHAYFASSTYVTDPPQKILQTFESMIRELRSRGALVLVLGEIPSSEGFEPGKSLARDFFRGRVSSIPLQQPEEELRKKLEPHQSLVLAAAQRAGAKVLDPFLSLCREGICHATDAQGRPLYKDGAHLRASFVRESFEQLDAYLSF